MKFYSLWDNQNGWYMHTGRNSESLDEVKEAILSYFSGDTDPDEMAELEKLPVEELAAVMDVTIHEMEDIV